MRIWPRARRRGPGRWLALATLLAVSWQPSQATGAVSPQAHASGGALSWRIDIDADATRAGFTLGALWHTVQGVGGPVQTDLRFDPESLQFEGWIRLQAASLHTGNPRRDRRMHADVLASESWPEITLWPLTAAGDFDPAAGGVLQVEAELELCGRRHPLSFPVEILVTEAGAFVADLAFSVPYVSWGLPDPSGVILRVDKEVRVTVKAAGRLRPPDGPTAP